MSKLSKAAAVKAGNKALQLDKTVTNFMGGDSYVLNPLETLKMVSASSIFGEPTYYRDGREASRVCGTYNINSLIGDNDVILGDHYVGKTTEAVMEELIDRALDYNFGATLEWAATLRDTFGMRLNPQVIMVRAAVHPKRKTFTDENPGRFDVINQQVMRRADEPLTQMAYYLYNNAGQKNNIPSVIKRSWAKKLGALDHYQVAKYKNAEIGMINGVRLCHANSPVINELMRTGTVGVQEDQKTWENIRSAGASWKEICNTITMGHMAMLRNLRGVFSEIEDSDFCERYLERLKDGVTTGRQFPFRYYSALRAVEKDDNCNHRPQIMNALEDCMDISMANFPRLKGKTMCLSDNSGSAWGAFNSEYGSVTVAEIDNLSSVMTAANSDEGYVGKFGDKLITYPISSRRGILAQANAISRNHSNDVGGGTEGGIWEFFDNAIRKKEHYDNIFVYSDQQAGHGGLYGTSQQAAKYWAAGYSTGSSYINVYKLIRDYRKKVNPKVNVFCIQTAGYDNALIPELGYRTAILYGWTGKEALFASEFIRQWDEIDNRQN